MPRVKQIQKAWGQETLERVKADEARIARERSTAEALAGKV